MLAVVEKSLCPSHSWISFMLTPLVRRRLAQLCRRSWNRIRRNLCLSRTIGKYCVIYSGLIRLLSPKARRYKVEFFMNIQTDRESLKGEYTRIVRRCRTCLWMLPPPKRRGLLVSLTAACNDVQGLTWSLQAFDAFRHPVRANPPYGKLLSPSSNHAQGALQNDFCGYNVSILHPSANGTGVDANRKRLRSFRTA